MVEHWERLADQLAVTIAPTATPRTDGRPAAAIEQIRAVLG
jgi:hypothetical protein